MRALREWSDRELSLLKSLHEDGDDAHDIAQVLISRREVEIRKKLQEWKLSESQIGESRKE